MDGSPYGGGGVYIYRERERERERGNIFSNTHISPLLFKQTDEDVGAVSLNSAVYPMP